MITRVFVYGTLKRGQCRESLWPCHPVEVIPAVTFGTLYDREDYPAMIKGQDLVSGECWEFAEVDMRAVLQTLDAIEGSNQPGIPDLYHRVEVEWWNQSETVDTIAASGAMKRAYAYHYARSAEADGFSQMHPSIKGAPVAWPPSDRS